MWGGDATRLRGVLLQVAQPLWTRHNVEEDDVFLLHPSFFQAFDGGERRATRGEHRVAEDDAQILDGGRQLGVVENGLRGRLVTLDQNLRVRQHGAPITDESIGGARLHEHAHEHEHAHARERERAWRAIGSRSPWRFSNSAPVCGRPPARCHRTGRCRQHKACPWRGLSTRHTPLEATFCGLLRRVKAVACGRGSSMRATAPPDCRGFGHRRTACSAGPRKPDAAHTRTAW